MPNIPNQIRISRSDMKGIIDTYVTERTSNTNDTGDNIIDQFKLTQYSNPQMIAGFLIVTFHKYKKKYTYQFSFYGFPNFKFTAQMESRIKLTDRQRTVY